MLIAAAALLWAGCGRPDPTASSTADTSAPTDSKTIDSGTTGSTRPAGPARRWDCAGLDPADAAPLGGKVALTFDDGPHVEHTADIVTILRGYNAPATFFVVGEMLADPDSWKLVEDMIDDPLFEIANHSWSHADLSAVSTTAMHREIDDTTKLIETFGVSPVFFRFPYGASTCGAADAARDRGLHVTGWHVDTVDWCYAAVGVSGQCKVEDYWRIPKEYENDMLGFTMEQVERFDGGVILMHDIHAYTVDTLDDLLDALAAADFEVVPLTDLDAFPRLNSDMPADLPFLGEACDPASDACWQIEYQSWCEPTAEGAETGICTIDCEGLCIDRPGAATTFCTTVEPGAGLCTGQSRSQNAYCDDIPGTTETNLSRWVGSSGASPATAHVCAPASW